MAEDYDLLVIGAGPGGYVAAIRAAQLGLRVACVEKYPSLGGTCLNVGCIPSKALLDSSERYAQTRNHLTGHGIKVGQVELDLATMLARKDKVVGGLTRGVGSLFKKNGVDRLEGAARIARPGVVAIEGKDAGEVHAKSILVATGSKPVELASLPFDDVNVVSSTQALCFEQVPPSLLVVGAGAIGLELGSVWSRLGSKVTVVELLDQIVPGADKEMSASLHKALRRQGLTFLLETTARDAEVGTDGVSVVLEGDGKQRRATFAKVLVAVGRRPFTDGLGLADLGIEQDQRGRIVVDEHYRTNVEGVLAIGDVIAGPMLAHKAEEEGVAAVERLAGVAGHVNYAAIPSVVYTWPELASVGMTSEQAAAQGREVRAGTFPFRANSRARCSDESDGLVKILADAKTDRILGIHILGPHASELIAEAAVAVEFSASAEDIARSVHAHPTLAEAIKEAALAVAGRTINI